MATAHPAMDSNHDLSLLDCLVVVGLGNNPKMLEHEENVAVMDDFDYLPSGDVPKRHDPLRDNYQPEVTHIYPESFDDPVMRDIAMFCFPENIRLRSASINEVSFFTFAMTNYNGTRRYAACLVFYDPLPATVTARLMKDHMSINSSFSRMRSGSTIDGSLSKDRLSDSTSDSSRPTFYAPKCLCLISHWPYFDTFKSLLFHIYMMSHADSLAFPLEHVLAELIQVIPAPPPGGIHLRFHVYGASFTISRPPLNELPILDFSLKYLFMSLGLKDILDLFTCILTEQKILFISRSTGLLHIIAESILALVYPFTWLHTYIPVLPTRLFETLSAPVPFIMGISSNHVDKLPELSDVVIVDLDMHTLKIPPAVILPALPLPEVHILANSLSSLAYPELRHFDKMYIPSFTRTPKGFQTQPVPRREHHDFARRHSSSLNVDDSSVINPKMKPGELRIHHSQSFASPANVQQFAHIALEAPNFEQNKIRMSFLKFFVSVMKDVNKYLVTMEKKKIYNGEEFLKTQPSESRKFFQVFFETQMFRRFVEDLNQRSRHNLVSVFDRYLDPLAEKVDFLLNIQETSDKCILLDIPGPVISLGQESVCYDHIFPDLDLEKYSNPDVSKLLSILNDYISKHPDIPQFHYLRAFVYEKMGDLVKAVADCDFVWTKSMHILPPKMMDRIIEKMSTSQLNETEDIGFKPAEIVRRVRCMRNPTNIGLATPTSEREQTENPVVFANTGIDFVEVLSVLGLAANGKVSKENFVQYSERLKLADDTLIARLLFEAIADDPKAELIDISQLETYIQTFTSICNKVPERLKLEDGEIVIRCSSKAYDKNAVAGHVILTNKQIYFGSDEFKPVVKLEKIQRCEEYNYRVLVPPGMPCIRIMSQEEITFCFWSFPERAVWVSYINEICAANQSVHESSEASSNVYKTMNNLLRTEALSLMHKKNISTLLYKKDGFNEAHEYVKQSVKNQRERKWGTLSMNIDLIPGLERITDPCQLSEIMCKLILKTFYMYVDMSTKSVDSQKFCTCESFKQYIAYMHFLKDVKLQTLSEDQRTAFFINIYNSLVVHMYAVYGVTATLQKKLNSQMSRYQIGDEFYSADDIKHGILRGNRPRKRRVIVLECRQFERGDPRLKFTISKFEPRVNFVLCKHTHVSPSVKVYTAANLEQDLQRATEEYCQMFIAYYHQKKEIHLPKVFYYCESDFGNNEEDMLRWISRYSQHSVSRAVQFYIEKPKEYTIVFDNDTTFEPKPFHQAD